MDNNLGFFAGNHDLLCIQSILESNVRPRAKAWLKLAHQQDNDTKYSDKYTNRERDVFFQNNRTKHKIHI